MKNIFKKTIASVAALSIMAAGSALSATAATGDVNLNLQDKVVGKAGETVTVNLYSVDAAQEANSFSFRLEYNPAELTLVSTSSNYGSPATKEKESNGVMLSQCAFSSTNAEAVKFGAEEVVIVSYTFKVNDNAKAGDEYFIKWADPSSYTFTLKMAGEENCAHTFDDGGSIIIEGETTTTEPTTTTVTTTTTTEPTTTTVTTTTTTEPTTTTATESTTVTTTTTPVTTTTTAAATTTKAATTTTKKVTTANTPPTGNSTEGVAALAATMVAAAGAAVVFKKKKD